MKKVKLNRVGNSWGRNWILNNGINPDFLVGLGLSLLDFEDCFVGRSFPQEIEIIEKDVSLPLEEEESRSRCLIRLDNGKYTFILKSDIENYSKKLLINCSCEHHQISPEGDAYVQHRDWAYETEIEGSRTKLFNIENLFAEKKEEIIYIEVQHEDFV